MKRIILFYVFIGYLVFPVLAKTPLERAIESGIAKNLNVKNILVDRKITELEKRVKEREKLFNASLKGNYLYRSEKIHMQLPDVTVSPQLTIPGMSFDAGTLHNFDVNISLQQPLFTGNIISNSVKIIERKKSINISSGSALKTRVSTLIKSSYFRYRLLKNRSGTVRILRDKLETHLKRVIDMFDEDLVRESDLLESENRAGELELEMNAIKVEMSKERGVFRDLTGLDVEDVEEGYVENIASEKESFDLFMKNHPSLKVLREREKILDLSGKIIDGQYLPRVALFTELHYGKPGINFFEDRWQFYLQAGVSLNMRVFDWGRKKNQKKIIEYRREKLDNEKRDLISVTQLKLRDLYKRIKIMKKNLRTAEKLKANALRDSGLKRDLYEAQQISNLRYLDSLLDVKKFETLKEKIVLQLELIKTAVNNLVGREVLNEKY